MVFMTPTSANWILIFHIIRFSGTLEEYIAKHKETLSNRQSLALLAQILEGLCHLKKNGVAHRDLKSDNILVNESKGPDELPHLVITDFDCCLAEKHLHGLEMPYETDETSKGGNMELMAPEVLENIFDKLLPVGTAYIKCNPPLHL